MREILKDHKICAIIRNIPLEHTVDYARAVYEGGVAMFEIAMNSPDACTQISMLRKEFEQEKACIGAGTVTTEERCRKAQAAGAQFFLTPSVSVATLKYCRKNKIPLLPGVMTPTDVAVCQEYGYEVMKLFPAGDLPDSYMKSLKGPFDHTDYVAVGGVTRENIRSFFQRGFIGVGIGSKLVPGEYVKNRMWQEAASYVRSYVKLVNPDSVNSD